MLQTLLMLFVMWPGQVARPPVSLAHSDWRVVSVERDGAAASDFQVTETRNGGPAIVNRLQTLSFARRQIEFGVGSDADRTGHQLNFSANWIPNGRSGRFRARLLGEWHQAEYRIAGDELTLSLFVDEALEKPLVIRAKAIRFQE